MKKKWSIFNIGLQKRTGFTIDPIFKRASELNMGWVNSPPVMLNQSSQIVTMTFEWAINEMNAPRHEIMMPSRPKYLEQYLPDQAMNSKYFIDKFP
jgi:hypothetical protein